MARPRIRRTFTAILGAVALGLTMLLAGTGTAGAAGAAETSGDYLALGDSVAFGYAPPAVTPPQWYLQPDRFRGYPEDLAAQLGLRDYNASCPGETTASFINDTKPSNGCENSAGSDIGYRDGYPLHVKYTGSQLAYAKHFLKTHLSTTQLVTINIGANDVFLCQATTSDQCTGSDFAQTMQMIGQNLAKILGTLRGTGYTGTLIVLGYYSTSYTDPILVPGTQLLNSVLGGVAANFGAQLADGFPVFKRISKPNGGDPCAAGLLIRMPDGTCNIHPSAFGHVVLSHLIKRTLNAAS